MADADALLAAIDGAYVTDGTYVAGRMRRELRYALLNLFGALVMAGLAVAVTSTAVAVLDLAASGLFLVGAVLRWRVRRIWAAGAKSVQARIDSRGGYDPRCDGGRSG